MRDHITIVRERNNRERNTEGELNTMWLEERDMITKRDGWMEVGGRRKNSFRTRWDHVGGKKLPSSASFFFTSFPENMMARDLYEVFKEYGEVDGVIIPERRDRSGKRFGFVRFFEVVDDERMAVKLDNIFIGKEKLFVNVPYFQRNKVGLQEVNGKSARAAGGLNLGSHYSKVVDGERGSWRVKHGLSFAKVTSKCLAPVKPSNQVLEYSFDASTTLLRLNKLYMGEGERGKDGL